MTTGLLITIEGVDGSGKTTQADLLVRWLRARGLPVVHTSEPGGTPLGERIREIILHGDALGPRPELLLYLADRAEHVELVLRPALQAGRVVVCERYADSSLAYQGYGREIPLEMIRALNAFATDGLQPDLTVLLAVSVDLGRRRKETVGPAPSAVEGVAPGERQPAKPSSLDRLEREDVEFRRRVAQGFLSLAEAEPDRFRVVCGERQVRAVHEDIVTAVAAALGARGIM